MKTLVESFAANGVGWGMLGIHACEGDLTSTELWDGGRMDVFSCYSKSITSTGQLVSKSLNSVEE